MGDTFIGSGRIANDTGGNIASMVPGVHQGAGHWKRRDGNGGMHAAVPIGGGGM